MYRIPGVVLRSDVVSLKSELPAPRHYSWPLRIFRVARIRKSDTILEQDCD